MILFSFSAISSGRVPSLERFTRYVKNVKTSVGVVAWIRMYTPVLFFVHFVTLTVT